MMDGMRFSGHVPFLLAKCKIVQQKISAADKSTTPIKHLILSQQLIQFIMKFSFSSFMLATALTDFGNVLGLNALEFNPASGSNVIQHKIIITQLIQCWLLSLFPSL